jgi:hypothetical protein
MSILVTRHPCGRTLRGARIRQPSRPRLEQEPIRILARKRIFVSGHRGMVGLALARRLAGERCEILTAPHAELDLRRQAGLVGGEAAEELLASTKAARMAPRGSSSTSQGYRTRLAGAD